VTGLLKLGSALTRGGADFDNLFFVPFDDKSDEPKHLVAVAQTPWESSSNKTKTKRGSLASPACNAKIAEKEVGLLCLSYANSSS
jgi:hypothetical protein